MSVYRRSQSQQRCQKWNSPTGVWSDVPYDAPETTPRDMQTEGMIVASTEDFTQEGPLVMKKEDLIFWLGALEDKR